MVEQNALRFHDDIAYDDEYNGLVVDNAEGDRLARVLGAKRVLFLANHGVIVVGPTRRRSVRLALLPRARLPAAGSGAHDGRQAAVRYGPRWCETAFRMMRDDAPKYAGAHFTALKRLLDREEPEYSR